MKSYSLRSLAVSYSHFMKQNDISDEIKTKMTEIFYNEELRKENNFNEIGKQMFNLVVKHCEICGHSLHLGEICPNRLKNPGLPENPTEGQIKHYDSWRSRAHANNGLKFCSKCNEETMHINGVGCISCHNKTEKMRNQVIELNKNNNGVKYCNICKKKTAHIVGIGCLICHNKKLWNDSKYREIMKESGFFSNFIRKNNVLYYYDKSIEDYVLWEDFKEKFQLLNQNIDFFNKIKRFYPDAFLQSTYRLQNSENWSNAKQAFEQDLVDKNISYFAYIKFYIDKNDGKIKPLVVGKTGSLLVNTTGTDVSFSEDLNDGPARIFLNETDQTWDKTQILIISSKDEQEALKKEKNLQKEYNLFGS